jgi:hypothetical protein
VSRRAHGVYVQLTWVCWEQQGRRAASLTVLAVLSFTCSFRLHIPTRAEGVFVVSATSAVLPCSWPSLPLCFQTSLPMTALRTTNRTSMSYLKTRMDDEDAEEKWKIWRVSRRKTFYVDISDNDGYTSWSVWSISRTPRERLRRNRTGCISPALPTRQLCESQLLFLDPRADWNGVCTSGC